MLIHRTPDVVPGSPNPTVVDGRWQTERVTRTLLLGRGWVGGAIEAAARNDERITHFTVIDPPFDPVLAERDAAATEHLRGLITRRGFDSVINACGRVSGSAEEMDDANHGFVEWLCGALEDTGVRLIHIGSASEYGDPGTKRPVDEKVPPAPVGAYATSKTRGTEVVLAARRRGLDASVARVFNIVGHPIPAVSPIHQWLSDITELGPDGGEIDVWWPATTRDFSLIEDVARALLDLCAAESTEPVVNVCSGIGIRYDEVVLAIGAELDIQVRIHSLERPGIEHVVGDPGLLRRIVGWTPQISARIIARRVTGGDL